MTATVGNAATSFLISNPKTDVRAGRRVSQKISSCGVQLRN